MNIQDIQNDIIDEFSMFDDWMQRYEYMIELGKSLPLISDQYKTDDNQLFLDTNMDAGHGGSSGRFEALKETAKEYTFILNLENKVP